MGDGDNETSGAHAPWTVMADPSGNFTATWVVPPDQDELGALLVVTADGQMSLWHTEAYFTDAAKTWDGGAGTNNGGDANNWNPNGVPVTGDAVTLINNTTVNVNVNATVGSITFPSGNNNNVTLNINPGVTLNVTTASGGNGTITIPRASTLGSAVNTLAVGTGTLNAVNIAFTKWRYQSTTRTNNLYRHRYGFG